MPYYKAEDKRMKQRVIDCASSVRRRKMKWMSEKEYPWHISFWDMHSKLTPKYLVCAEKFGWHPNYLIVVPIYSLVDEKAKLNIKPDVDPYFTRSKKVCT